MKKHPVKKEGAGRRGQEQESQPPAKTRHYYGLAKTSTTGIDLPRQTDRQTEKECSRALLPQTKQNKNPKIQKKKEKKSGKKNQNK
jgi:hypothetical protein